MNENIFGSMSTLGHRARYLARRMKGITYHQRLNPIAPGADESPKITVYAEVDHPIDQIQCVMLQPDERTIPLRRENTQWDLLNWSYFQVWRAKLPPQPEGTLVRYKIEAYANGSMLPLNPEENRHSSYISGKLSIPAWAESAVVYQIMPDRFNPGAGRTWNEVNDPREIYGGTIAGIIEKLDHLVDLGINCLWLNPFFPDKTHHGYHILDFFAVNPRLGTLADVRTLVAEAHARGIRLILDFVANHLGRSHPIFQEAISSPQSDYRNWFFWHSWPENYVTYFNVRELPKINVDYPAAREHLFDSVRFWLGEVGFDGLRLDHAQGPSYDYWTELRAVATSIKPDVWVFGEVVEHPEKMLTYTGRFHGCLDFLLAQVIRDVFAHGTMDVAALDNFLHNHEAFFPENFSRPSFFDNHDMDRFLWAAAGDIRKLKLAAICLYTLSGPPILYYGTEVGLSQENGSANGRGWAECRLPMPWGDKQDRSLFAFFRELIHFRKQHPSIWQSKRKTLYLNAKEGVLVYGYRGQHATVLVVLNLSHGERTIEIRDPDWEIAQQIHVQPVSGAYFSI